MTKPIARDPIYRRRVFDAEIIELCVRWYITYRLSYRDLVALMDRFMPNWRDTRELLNRLPARHERWNY